MLFLCICCILQICRPTSNLVGRRMRFFHLKRVTFDFDLPICNCKDLPICNQVNKKPNYLTRILVLYKEKAFEDNWFTL